MIRIAYIINNLVVGGAEKLLLNVIKNLDKKQYQCYVYTLFRNNPLKDEFIRNGAVVIEIKMQTNREFWKIFGLSKLLKANRINIVHTHLCDADLYGRYAARMAGRKVIISTEHSIDPWKYSKDIIRKVRKMFDLFSIRFTNLIICVSKVVQDYHTKWGIPPHKTLVLYPAIPFRTFTISKVEKRKQLGISADDLVVANVGRFFEVKNHKMLIQVALEILQDIKDITFVTVGDGPLRKECMDLVKNSKFSNKILFLGTRNDVDEILQISDIFVLPSLYEGFPLSVIEAMYYKLPVIVSNVGGIPEIVENNMGILINPLHKNELKNAILRLYSNKELRNSMGNAGYRKVSDSFNLLTHINRLTTIYHTLLNR